MILKGNCDFWGIGLLEVLWKIMAVILNICLGTTIDSHEKLHRFCSGRGMGNVSLKANLKQQMEYTREEALYNIFLDIHKT